MGDSSTTEAELEAFEAMAEYVPWVKAAIEAYGFYQKFLSLGSVKRQLSLQDIITRSENRIIAAIKTTEMTQCINNLRAVASSWENTCEPFLESNPISPDTVSAFEHAITVQTVNDKVTVAIGVVEFFSKNDKQEYVSFEAITTAITLLFSLLTVRETYFIAAENHKMDTAILSKQVQRAIDVMQAWPDKYINRRVDYLSVEIEQKYSGRADPLGGGRQKHPTGWYTLHDSAPDPATGNFEGFRVNYFPNRLTEVKKRFQQSKLATEILPKLLANWAALKATALVSEAFPLPAASPHTWLRLSSLSSPSMNLDVANDPNGVSNDAQLQLTRQGNYSGQFWHVRPSDTSPGRWNFCSLFLGRGMCLDVYGNNKIVPHLTTAGNYSGQQWQLIKKSLHHAWSFSNAYSGDDMVLSTVTNPDGSIKLTVESRDDEKMAQMWVVTAIRPITEPGY